MGLMEISPLAPLFSAQIDSQMIWSGDSPDLSVGTPAQFVIAPACRQASLNADLSVVDIKDNEVESPDLIASRIERAAKTLGRERIRFVNPDCGLWMLSRSVADRKMRALVVGCNLYQGSRSRKQTGPDWANGPFPA